MSKRVVIADDDESIVAVLARRCRALGIQVYTAYDALEAMKKIDEYAPDLVILDIRMPAGNGLSVCEMMANTPEWSLTPVIMLTGRNDRETIRRCHDLLAYYVLKGDDVWSQVEPLVRQLLDMVPGQLLSLRGEDRGNLETATPAP